MDGHESNLFEKLPNEVLQLIFTAIGDCKTLVHCMVVSKAFQGHASKVTSLKISFPKQLRTYAQKLWNVHSMVKNFKALESLIVCVGQPKKEPPTSWARCMRYAEIGVAVEKFIFMAAKSGDFVEFDHSLGLRSQLKDDNVSNVKNGKTPKNEHKDVTFKNVNEHDVDHGLHVNDENALFVEEDERELANNTNTTFSTSRQEQRSGLYTISTIDSLRNNKTLTPQLSVQENSNISAILPNENNLEYEKGESSNSFNLQDYTKGHISLCKKTHNLPNQPQFNQETFHIPIINFHLKQVIAPSNDVLKQMVPIIVFAIIQGLDEFCNTIPNFIEKFVNLKRFVLVDVVESLTVHMREHQIQQVRNQRLEIISRYISESVANESNAKTSSKNEEYKIQKTKVANTNEKQTNQCNQSNEVNHVDEKIHLDVGKNAQDWNKDENFKSAPLKLQIHEIRSKLPNSKLEKEPSMFESCPQEKQTCQPKPTIYKTQTSQKFNQIIKSPISNNICDVCQDMKSQGNYVGMCWHQFPNGFSNSIPSINLIESNNLSCDLPPLTIEAWLKEKQSLGGPQDMSQVSKDKIEEFDCMPQEHKRIKDCIQTKTYEEIMACQLQDDLSKQFSNTIIITNPKTINEETLNQTLLNSHVTFSNNQNFIPIKKNVDQITPRPTTSITNKPKRSKCNKFSNKFLENSHVNKLIEEEASRLNSLEKPSNFEESFGGSSTSFNFSKREIPNLNFELRKFSTLQTKLYEKNKIQHKKTKCLHDSNNNSKTHQLKNKPNHRKYTTLRESNSKYIGKNSFKRGLLKETSKRRVGDRASRIANSRRHENNCQSKNDEWVEGGLTKKSKEENIPLLKCNKENPEDFWNIPNKSNSFSNDIKFDINKNDNNRLDDIKGKKIAIECFNYEKTASSNEIPLEVHDQIITYEQDEAYHKNDIANSTTWHKSKQLSLVSSNHDEHLNPTTIEGVVAVPYESDSTIVNNQLQGLFDLEYISIQSQNSPRIDLSPNLSPRNDDTSHNEVAWIGARAREQSGLRRFGRRSRARSMRRENHAHTEREREARRERLRDGIHQHQRDIEQEALFFDISFWRSEQVLTHNYILSEVSMCIATHDAKPLTEEELEILSTIALAGPLLAATITYVNEQIGSHNL